MNQKAISVFLCTFICIVSCKHTHPRRQNRDVDDVNADNKLDSDQNQLEIASDLDNDGNDTQKSDEIDNGSDDKDNKKYTCWLDLEAKKLFNRMDKLDERYDKVRTDYQNAVGTDSFDKLMLTSILEDQGRAPRALHSAGGDPRHIPAGLNLGGYCMMRMADSVLFFHRMKLRNNTRFRINYLHNDLHNMLLTVQMSLHDLHLAGSYERAGTGRDPSYLFYRPTYGQVEFLLKDVKYKMESRYRLIKDRLVIELVLSTITVTDILVTYHNNATSESVMKLERRNIDEFLSRLKVDLDKWLKDYFNDRLTLFALAGAESKEQFLTYDKQKAMILNEYVDRALDLLKYRLRQLRSVALKVPNFTIHTSNGMTIKLREGVLRGLDSMHRRSVATGKKENKVRYVDAVLGFSKLKLEYKYEGQLAVGLPPLRGMFILSADELTAQMGLALVKDPDAVDLHVEFLEQNKPESLTVEGAINMRISNFKHLLETQIISIMSNMLVHHIRMLSYLSKCTIESPLPGHVDPGEIYSEETLPKSDTTESADDREDSDQEENPNDNNKTKRPESIGDSNQESDNKPIDNEYNITERPKIKKYPNEKKKAYNEEALKADFAVDRVDSIELVLPPKYEGKEGKKMKLNYKQVFSIAEVTKS